MIYVFLANGFEEIEAIAPVDILRRCKQDVMTVGIGGKFVIGSHHIPVAADLEEKEIRYDDLEAVVLPGGMPGTLNLEASVTVKKAIEFAVKNDKLIASICAAPSILGHMGILAGKEAICFPGYEEECKGARISDKKVVVDGNIITAAGAGVAIPFGAAIAERFAGPEKVERVLASLQCG